MGNKGSRGIRIALTTLATVGTALAITAPAGADSAAPPAPRFHVVGVGGGKLTFPGFEGDPVRFGISAHGVPGQSDGRFHVNHRRSGGRPFADFTGKVDCVATQGDLGIVTGVIDKADLPGLPGVNLIGRRVGFTVRDEPKGHDRIGWSWAVGGFDADTLPCAGTIPFFSTEFGDYVVRD